MTVVDSRYYRPDVDGLRAVAVVLVILNHLDFACVPSGYVGVDVFFVISGYLITGILCRDIEKLSRARNGRVVDSPLDGPGTSEHVARINDVPSTLPAAISAFSLLRNFWLRRMRRILPALLLLLTVVTVAAMWVYRWNERVDYSLELAATHTFVANWYWSTDPRRFPKDFLTNYESVAKWFSEGATQRAPWSVFPYLQRVLWPVLQNVFATEDALLKTFFAPETAFESEHGEGQDGYFGRGTNARALRHLWSLSVEEQFYFVWPFVVVGAYLLVSGAVGVVCGRRGGEEPSGGSETNRPRLELLVTHALLILVGSVFAYQSWREMWKCTSPSRAYFEFRAWQIMAGALLALLEQEVLVEREERSSEIFGPKDTELQEFGLDQGTDSTTAFNELERRGGRRGRGASAATFLGELLVLNALSIFSLILIVYGATCCTAPNWHDRFAFRRVLLYPVVGSWLFVAVGLRTLF